MVHMFEWLEAETAEIHTPKFHVVDGPASPGQVAAIAACTLAIPPSYRQFATQFGNASLYRQGNSYQVEVLAEPREAVSRDGERLLQCGKTDAGLAFFKHALLVPDGESPVFMWHGPSGGLRQSADGFAEWLEAKCRTTRRRYRKAEWAEIQNGPAPFTPREAAIVAARAQFQWKVAGIADNGDLIFDVHNGSDLVLSYLTIGVRRRDDGEPFGSVWVPVGNIAPGTSATVKRACHKKLIAPSAIETYAEPQPGPEDRLQYWEFKTPDPA